MRGRKRPVRLTLHAHEPDIHMLHVHADCVTTASLSVYLATLFVYQVFNQAHTPVCKESAAAIRGCGACAHGTGVRGRRARPPPLGGALLWWLRQRPRSSSRMPGSLLHWLPRHACMRPRCHQLAAHACLSQSAFRNCAADSLECSADMLCLLLQKDVTEQHAAAASSATAAAGAPEPRALASSRQASARAAPMHAATQRTSPTAATAASSTRVAARTQQHSQLQRTATNACLKPCIHWRRASARGVCARSNRGCRVRI